MRLSIRNCITNCLLLVCTMQVCFVQAAETGSKNLNYVITTSGNQVGSVAVISREEGKARIEESTYEMNLESIWGDFSFIQRSRSERRDGQLVTFEHWLVAGDERYHFTGRCEEKNLLINIYEGKSIDSNSVETESNATSSASMILDQFSGEEHQGEEKVPLTYYDTTDLNLYEYLMSFPVWNGTKIFKVFFTDSLERKRVKAHYLKSEKVQISNMKFQCEVFRLVMDNEIRTLWLAKDAAWGVLTVKEENEEDGFNATILLQADST